MKVFSSFLSEKRFIEGKMIKMKYLKVIFLFIIISYIIVNIFWKDAYKVETFFRIAAAINLIFIIKERLGQNSIE